MIWVGSDYHVKIIGLYGNVEPPGRRISVYMDRNTLCRGLQEKERLVVGLLGLSPYLGAMYGNSQQPVYVHVYKFHFHRPRRGNHDVDGAPVHHRLQARERTESASQLIPDRWRWHSPCPRNGRGAAPRRDPVFNEWVLRQTY
jgi:hypothetical protein